VHKKASSQLTDVLLFIFIYIPMTIVIVASLVTTPSKILTQSLQPMQLDATIMHERIIQQITYYSPLTGSHQRTIEGIPQFYPTNKRYANRASIGEQQYYFNKLFFDTAYPLAPVVYNKHSYYQHMNGENEILVETIHVFPKNYDTFN